ncbi:ABC transporter substrate-binding protein [Saccharomonospora sp. NPDC046836]|uniref:ABC transporter substrate-binding protein n=1 Tax=Saccharomonospora sp. NPDC046836 TaxID=3156921 RepID=UPI0033C74827
MLVSLSALATACAGRGGSGGPGADTCKGATVAVTATTPSFNFLPYYVANGAGLFSQRGLNVQMVEVATGASNLAALLGGSADLTFTPMPELLNSRAEGAPVVGIGSLQTEWASNLVMKRSVMEQRGITEASTPEEKVEALRGLRIAITGPGSGSDLVVRYLLQQGGMNPDTDVQLTSAGSGQNAVSGFISDRFDVFALSSPGADIGITRGDGAYLFNLAQGEYPRLAGMQHITLQAAEQRLDEKRAALGCFTDAIQEALDIIHNDPARVPSLAKELQDYVGNDQDLFNQGLQSNLPSYPKRVAIDPHAAELAAEAANVLNDGHVDRETLESAIVDIHAQP